MNEDTDIPEKFQGALKNLRDLQAFTDAEQVGDMLIEDVAEMLRKVPQWQPISTAPKDGRYVLLFWNDTSAEDGNIESGKWYHRQWRNSDYYPLGEPTHWMPLPEPPK